MIRFGLGLRAGSDVVDGAALMADLDRADRAAITPFATRLARAAERAALRRAQREGRMDDTRPERRAINRMEGRDSLSDLRETVAQMIVEPIGFRDRLTAFWANHFAADTRRGHFRFARASFTSTKPFRPHIAGRFRHAVARGDHASGDAGLSEPERLCRAVQPRRAAHRARGE